MLLVFKISTRSTGRIQSDPFNLQSEALSVPKTIAISASLTRKFARSRGIPDPSLLLALKQSWDVLGSRKKRIETKKEG